MNKEKGKMMKEGRIESRDEGSMDVSNDRKTIGGQKEIIREGTKMKNYVRNRNANRGKKRQSIVMLW